ncbi:hypothetical protein LPJ75_004474 [Coemansia sp. RSA 2598]|nr:hypothetical protein LPJ75_004474 [Coemansia sp. RSA 2598]
MSYPGFPGHGHGQGYGHGHSHSHGSPPGPPHDSHQHGQGGTQGSTFCKGPNCGSSGPPTHHMGAQRPEHTPYHGMTSPPMANSGPPHTPHSHPGGPASHPTQSPLGPVVFRTSASGKGDDIQEWRMCNM